MILTPPSDSPVINTRFVRNYYYYTTTTTVSDPEEEEEEEEEENEGFRAGCGSDGVCYSSSY